MQREAKNSRAAWRTAFAAALVLFILFGLGTKLLLSSSLALNSDMVGEGLEAMEIWRHQNYLLDGYYLPSQDTFLFTELLPFQLIPQALTDFDPAALRLAAYAEFVLGVGILAYVVYLATGEALGALLFAALAANVPPAAYPFFSLPTSHAGTVVFLGLMLALLAHAQRKDGEKAAGAKKGRKARPAAGIRWPAVVALAVLTALTVASDTIILPWLIIPFILAYIVFAREKSRTMNAALAAMAAVSVAVYACKTYFIYTWVSQDIVTGGGTSAVVSTLLPLYFQALALVLNEGLYGLVAGSSGFGALEAVSLALFAALAAYAAWNALRDGRRRLFYGVLLASAAVMFAMFIVSDYTVDISSARYLTFTAFALLMLIAAALPKGDKAYAALALGLLAVSAAYGYIGVSGLSGSPNAAEYGLIDYLKQNNLTFGYGTYWNSNVITYLSGEEVTVRAAFFYRDGLKPNVWLASEEWYRSTPDRSFILVDRSALDDNGRAVVRALAAELNASEALGYGNFDIYPVEGYHIASFQVMR